MGYIESKCPHCGKVNRFSCNTYAYGSPIVNCKDCREEFVEKKFREVAVEGFDPRTTNPKFYVKAIPLSFALCSSFASSAASKTRATPGIWKNPGND